MPLYLVTIPISDRSHVYNLHLVSERSPSQDEIKLCLNNIITANKRLKIDSSDEELALEFVYYYKGKMPYVHSYADDVTDVVNIKKDNDVLLQFSITKLAVYNTYGNVKLL